MRFKQLVPILCIALFLLSACPSEPAGQAIEIATPTRSVATVAPEPIEPTATEPVPTVALAPTATAEIVSLPAPTDTPIAEPTEATVTSEDPWAAVDPSEQTVHFWHRHTTYRAKILNEIIDDFNANNPHGIWVEAQAFEDYGKLFESTMEAAGTADTPSLVLGFQSDLASYYLADASLDLTSLLESPQWGFDSNERTDFFNWSLDAELAPNLGNVRTGLPMDRAVDVLFVNRNWLTELGVEKLPASPEEFRSAACAASQTPFSGDQIGKGIGFELSDNASNFASWVFAFGGDVYDPTSGQFTLDSAEAITAWTFLQGLIDEGCARITGERYGDQTDFGNGIALFAVGASSSFYFYDKAVKDGADFVWEVTPLPHTTQRAVLNLSGPSIALIKSTPAQELAAWLFLKHYASAEMQAKWARAVEGFPIRGSAFDTMGKYLNDKEAYRSLVAYLPDGRSEPSVPGYGFIRGAISDAISAIAGGADVESTLRQLNAEANATVERQLENR